MPTEGQDFWDELGVAWRAQMPQVEAVPAGLETRLRWQTRAISATVLFAGALSLSGVPLAAWTLWLGWLQHWPHFLVRGITIAGLAGIAGLVALRLRSRIRADADTLTAHLALAAAQCRQLVRAVDLSLCALGVLAVGGLLGYLIRSRTGHPPAISLLTDLLALGVVLLALLWYRQNQSQAFKKLQYLGTAFDPSRD